VLAVTGRVAPPSVIGHDGQEIRSFFRGYARPVAIDGFVADHRADFAPFTVRDGFHLFLCTVAVARSAEFLHERAQEGEPVFVGDDFHTRNEFRLDIGAIEFFAVEYQGCVVEIEPVLRSAGAGAPGRFDGRLIQTVGEGSQQHPGSGMV